MDPLLDFQEWKAKEFHRLPSPTANLWLLTQTVSSGSFPSPSSIWGNICVVGRGEFTLHLGKSLFVLEITSGSKIICQAIIIKGHLWLPRSKNLKQRFWKAHKRVRCGQFLDSYQKKCFLAKWKGSDPVVIFINRRDLSAESDFLVFLMLLLILLGGTEDPKK